MIALVIQYKAGKWEGKIYKGLIGLHAIPEAGDLIDAIVDKISVSNLAVTGKYLTDQEVEELYDTDFVVSLKTGTFVI